jgi:uncharacterized membrane protein
MTHSTAVAIAVGIIVGAWVLYEGLYRMIGERWPRATMVLAIIVLVYAVVLLTTFFPGRAAFVHIGALLGTIMAGSVAFTIMPSQRELVSALSQGREPSQVIADRAKTRSIHNNYITFPVIAFMVSAHFPALYAGRNAAAAALVLIAGGALVRHWMNVRFTNPSWKVWLPVTASASAVMLVFTMGIGPTPPMHSYGGSGQLLDSLNTGVVPEISFAEARRIIDRRCTTCHSMTPSDISLGRTPLGITFDTPQQIVALAGRIRERAVVQQTMPPGNKTIMTDVERAMLARWIESGALVQLPR